MVAVRGIYSLTMTAVTPTRRQGCRQLAHQQCEEMERLDLRRRGKREKKEGPTSTKTDRKSKTKARYSDRHHCRFATTEKGINSNRSELFTTCTHHTHRMSAWQPAIILQVLHERWLSYPLTLFVLHPSLYPRPIRVFPHVVLAVETWV